MKDINKHGGGNDLASHMAVFSGKGKLSCPKKSDN